MADYAMYRLSEKGIRHTFFFYPNELYHHRMCFSA